jgi:hypothetical protein
VTCVARAIASKYLGEEKDGTGMMRDAWRGFYNNIIGFMSDELYVSTPKWKINPKIPPGRRFFGLAESLTGTSLCEVHERV